MLVRYPNAIWRPIVGVSGGSWDTTYPWRGVLHTTEGSTAAGALATYPQTRAVPHFTVDENSVWQHLPLDKFATALQNRTGGVETNRARCIQIEYVGFASKGIKHSGLLEDLLRWIEGQTGIQPRYEVNLNRDSTWWKGLNAWTGHRSVPENNHTDPGSVDSNLFTVKSEIPTTTQYSLGGEDEMLNAAQFTNIKVDSNGNGWVSTGLEFSKVVSVFSQGSATSVTKKYNVLPDLGISNVNGLAEVQVKSTPGSLVGFTVIYRV